MTIRAENKKKTIKKIVDSFYLLIQEKEYGEISIQDIKNKAEISIGAIYHHFPNGKSDILHKMVNMHRKKILNLEVFNNIDESDLNKSIKTTLLNFIKFHRENIQFFLAFEQLLLINRKIFYDFRVSIEEELLILTKKLKSFKNFINFSENKLQEKLFLLFQIIQSIILRHISLIPLFETDDEFGDYLTKLTLFHLSN